MDVCDARIDGRSVPKLVIPATFIAQNGTEIEKDTHENN
jgi:hypothetical protein